MGGDPPTSPLDPPLLDTDLASRRTFRVTPGSITASEFDSSFFFSCHTDRNSRRSPHFITAINKILVNGVTCCMKVGSTFCVFFKVKANYLLFFRFHCIWCYPPWVDLAVGRGGPRPPLSELSGSAPERLRKGLGAT